MNALLRVYEIVIWDAEETSSERARMFITCKDETAIMWANSESLESENIFTIIFIYWIFERVGTLSHIRTGKIK